MEIQYTEFQDKLVRGLSHKMNNILSLFHGYLGLVMDDPRLHPELKENLSRIQLGAQAATDLIDRTKALVRPTSLIWREIRPHEFLHGLRSSIAKFLERDVTVEITCPDDLPNIRTDAARLRSAILELVQNAVEASEPGGVVHLKASAQERHGIRNSQWLAIEVVDAGPGIREKPQERVFDPFYTTKAYRGASGLGLSVATGFVQQLEGTITFSSEPGYTVFTILLPAVQA